jgi:YVTN family beta-propeller protein
MPDVQFSRRTLLRRGGLAAAGLLGLAAIAPEPARGGPATTPAPAASPGRPIALIANSMSDSLTLVDARTFEPFKTMPVGREPHKFRLSLDGRSVYSCNTTSNELIEIDLATLQARRRIPMLDPYNVLFTHDRRYLYKVAYRYDFVEIHDGETFRPIKRLKVGRQPSHMWLSPDGRWFVNTNQHSDSVTVIDIRAMLVARTVRVDHMPAGIQISPDGHYMFVASHVGTISVFETDGWSLVKKVHSGTGAHEMVATRDGRTIFVTNRYEDTTSAFDVSSQRVVAKFPVPGGPDMPMLSPDGAHLWVSGRFKDTASVIDTKTLKKLATFQTGRSPHGVFLGRTTA